MPIWKDSLFITNQTGCWPVSIRQVKGVPQIEVETLGRQLCIIDEYHCRRSEHSLSENSGGGKWQLVRFLFYFLNTYLFYMKKSKIICLMRLQIKTSSQGPFHLNMLSMEWAFRTKMLCIKVLSSLFKYIIWFLWPYCLCKEKVLLLCLIFRAIWSCFILTCWRNLLFSLHLPSN